MEGLAVELQRGLVLRVVDVDHSARVGAQQRVDGHAELHVETLHALENRVVVQRHRANLHLLAFVKLHLKMQIESEGNEGKPKISQYACE